jgi:hypothetical protein
MEEERTEVTAALARGRGCRQGRPAHCLPLEYRYGNFIPSSGKLNWIAETAEHRLAA